MNDVEKYLNKRITAVRFADNALYLAFEDGPEIRIFDDGQLCCESRYMRTDDDVESLLGIMLQSITVKPGPPEEEEYIVHDVEFFELQTDKGFVTFSNHNEHNGYYGGFWLKIEENDWLKDHDKTN